MTHQLPSRPPDTPRRRPPRWYGWRVAVVVAFIAGMIAGAVIVAAFGGSDHIVPATRTTAPVHTTH